MKPPGVLFSLSARIAACAAALRRHATAGLGVLLTAMFAAQPASAQKLHSYEPLMMDPYSTIYVNDGSCSAGKVLKVQGAPRNHRRKKSCVPMSDLQSGAPRSQPAR
jgi:hypothetical protein